MIQIQLQLFPKPLSPVPQLLEHPQLVAVKSLILSASRFYYGLSYVAWHVNVSSLFKNIWIFLVSILHTIHGKKT